MGVKKLFLSSLIVSIFLLSNSYSIQSAGTICGIWVPQEVTDYFNEKNSWGETFRDPYCPQPFYSMQSGFFGVAYWSQEGLIDSIVYPLVYNVNSEWDENRLLFLAQTNLLIENYGNDEEASAAYENKFLYTKSDRHNTKAEFNVEIGDDSYTFYNEWPMPYEMHKSYVIVFRKGSKVYSILPALYLYDIPEHFSTDKILDNQAKVEEVLVLAQKFI